MKSTLVILALSFAVVCAVFAVELFSLSQSNHSLREANQELQNALRAAQVTADTRDTERRETAAQLALAQTRSEELTAQIAQIQTASARAETRAIPAPKPYQADAFLGQEWLGTAWIIPRNLRMDTNTQRYVYEPVVWLDERLRNSFVTHHTNVVEREIETQTTYNNSYYPPPVYYLAHPSGYRSRPNPSPPGGPASTPTAYPAPPAFNPGSGAVIPQKLGTPAGQIKTLP